MPSSVRAKIRARVLTVGAMLVAAGVVGFALAPAAQAAQLAPTIDGATFTHARDSNADGLLDPISAADPLKKNGAFRLGLDFSLPVPIAVGDSFTIAFPPEIEGSITPPFDLKDADGNAIGTCEVGPTSFTCRLTNPIVATWETTTPFNVFFNATARKDTTSTTLPFTVVGGDVFSIPGPSGGIVIGDGTKYPTTPYKSGWTDTSHPGEIQWVIYLPSTTAVTYGFTDTLGAGEGQSFVPGSVDVNRTVTWNPQNLNDGRIEYADDEVDITFSGDLQKMDILFPTYPEIGDNGAYWVRYRTTVPADVTFGDTFTNSVSGSQATDEHTVTYNSDVGGSGGGSALPDIAITKVAVGETTAQTYDFTLACTLDGTTTTYTASAAAGETATVRDLAVGTSCTIVEDDTFGADVTFSPSSTIVVSDAATPVIAVTATNTFPTESTPTPTPTDTPTPTPTDTPTPTPTPTDTPTPTPTPTDTPTPTPTPEVTPTPTPTSEVTPTPTPTSEVTPTPTPTSEVTPTPTPTAPPAVTTPNPSSPPLATTGGSPASPALLVGAGAALFAGLAMLFIAQRRRMSAESTR